jgi:hypothetical protein
MNVGLKTPIMPAGVAAVAAAVHGLSQGGLVAFPTETVYGLGADASNARAIARLYQAKGRPAFNPLIAHVVDLEAAMRLARFDATAIALARAFWPGPLTLVLPKSENCPGSTPSPSGCPPMPWRGTSCARSGGPLWRHRRTCPVMSRRPRQRTYKAISRGGST